MPRRPSPVASPDRASILGKAFLRASASLRLSQREAARILGVSEATMSRVNAGRGIDPGSKEGEIAALFLRAFRSLDALVGGREDHARLWLRANNAHLGGIHAEQLSTVSGLVHVVEYLDAVRGKL